MFFLLVNSKKVQLIRELKNYCMICQGLRLLCENDQGYCNPIR